MIRVYRMERDLDTVKEIYRAWARKDIRPLLTLMPAEVEVTQSSELPWGGCYVGPEGLRRYVEAITESLESRVEFEQLIDAGDRVVAVGRLTGKAKATQLEFEVPLVHVWKFRDGQITALEIYSDNSTLLAALGA